MASHQIVGERIRGSMLPPRFLSCARRRSGARRENKGPEVRGVSYVRYDVDYRAARLFEKRKGRCNTLNYCIISSLNSIPI
jgi:hypothetical protein